MASCQVERFLVFEKGKNKYFWPAALCTLRSSFLRHQKSCYFLLVIECFLSKDLAGSSFPLLLLFPFFRFLKEACLSQTFISSALPSFLFFIFNLSFTLSLLLCSFFLHNSTPSLKSLSSDTQVVGSLKEPFCCLVPSEACHSAWQEQLDCRFKYYLSRVE